MKPVALRWELSKVRFEFLINIYENRRFDQLSYYLRFRPLFVNSKYFWSGILSSFKRRSFSAIAEIFFKLITFQYYLPITLCHPIWIFIVNNIRVPTYTEVYKLCSKHIPLIRCSTQKKIHFQYVTLKLVLPIIFSFLLIKYPFQT